MEARQDSGRRVAAGYDNKGTRMLIRSIRSLLGLGFAATLLFVAGTGQPVSAQDEELFPLNAVSHACDSDPGVLGFGSDPAVYDAAGCEAVAGISYVAHDLGGNEIDSCATASDTPGCQMLIPYGLDVEVTQLDAGLAAGYAPRENPILINVPDAPVAGEAPIAIFVNLPEGEAPDDSDDDAGDVTTLPSTGVGPSDPDKRVSHWLFVIGAGLLAVANFVLAGRKLTATAAARVRQEP